MSETTCPIWLCWVIVIWILDEYGGNLNTNLLLKFLLGRRIQTFKNDNKDGYKSIGHFIEFFQDNGIVI